MQMRPGAYSSNAALKKGLPAGGFALLGMGVSRRRRAHQRAFTLMELLVVIVIVAILGSLVLSVGGRMMERSKFVGCANNMRQIYTALMLYRAEHNGWFPPGKQIFYSSLGSPYETTIRNGLLGEKYLSKNFVPAGYLSEMPVCPAMRLQKTEEAARRYPNEKRRLKELGSYGINAFLLSTKVEGLPGPYWESTWPIRGPYPGDSRMVLLTEGSCFGATYVWSHITNVLNGHDNASRLTAPRDHGSLKLNFMFLDGHIEALAPKKGGVSDATVSDRTDYDWSEHFSKGGENGKKISPTYVLDPKE